MAGFGKSLTIFAETPSKITGLIWAKDEKIIPNDNISIVISFFSKVKVIKLF